MTSPRHRRTPKAAEGEAAGTVATREPVQAPTLRILPAEPDAITALRTTVFPPPVADEPAVPQARPATARELTVTTDGDAWRVFGGRPLSLSATVRDAWFRANPGPEPIFAGTVADLEAMWLLDPSLPPPPRRQAAEATQDPVSVAVTGTDGPPPRRPAAAETVNDPGPEAEPPAGAPAAPLASGPVSTEDEPDAEPDCAEGGEIS